MVFFGIDTSCYTTSFAVVDLDGRLLEDRRLPLRVPAGGRGLRQSEMVFQHVKHMGRLAVEAGEPVGAIAVSAAPRPQKDSYMPVFAVSDSFGRAIAAATGAKLYPLTHQHGHIGAAMFQRDVDGDFLGIHVSGGTTDVLLVSAREGVIKEIRQLGQTSDIAAGQLIDRIGVRLGISFPCGPGLEAMAGGEPLLLKSSVKGMCASFSGAETAAERLLAQGESPAAVALSVQKCVAKTLEKLIVNARRSTGVEQALLFGGVMCNQYIKDFLNGRLDGLAFAEKRFASDNACGLAMQARNRFLQENRA